MSIFPDTYPSLLLIVGVDSTYEYGPCIGVSRLERWERARAMGLNPPVAVSPSAILN